MPTARWGAASGVIDGKLYVVGGTTGTNSLAILEVYDPVTVNLLRALHAIPR